MENKQKKNYERPESSVLNIIFENALLTQSGGGGELPDNPNEPI